MAQTLDFLSGIGIVHCDLKPDNILVEHTAATAGGVGGCSAEVGIKLIDFGSAFLHDEKGQLGMLTPEYIPPEVLSISDMIIANETYSKPEILSQAIHPWSVDVWSLGCIIVEIIIGVPLWLSLRCKNKVRRKTKI